MLDPGKGGGHGVLCWWSETPAVQTGSCLRTLQVSGRTAAAAAAAAQLNLLPAAP
jgi:hypothetical protein